MRRTINTWIVLSVSVGTAYSWRKVNQKVFQHHGQYSIASHVIPKCFEAFSFYKTVTLIWGPIMIMYWQGSPIPIWAMPASTFGGYCPFLPQADLWFFCHIGRGMRVFLCLRSPSLSPLEPVKEIFYQNIGDAGGCSHIESAAGGDGVFGRGLL